MAATTTQRRRLTPERRREEILDIAIGVIGNGGYNGMSMGGLAEECGITKAGLQHHFPSKEQLLTAVLDHRDELDAYAIGADIGPATDAAQSRDLLTRLVRRNQTQPAVIQMYTILSAEALDPTHPAHDYFTQRLNRSLALMERFAFAWHPTPRVCATLVLAFLDGLQLNWLRDPSVDLLAHWEGFANFLYSSGIGQPSTATP